MNHLPVPAITPEQAAALRKPFEPSQIGKLPKPYKKDSEKKKCAECGGFHGEGVHLDYVGHAATTDRLLQVDPLWNWEPLALTPEGLPKVDAAGGLWIKLTVCGVTRLGYGDASMGHGVKEAIGDAIRNAAMRFGVALDLWSKEELTPRNESDDTEKRRSASKSDSAPNPDEPEPTSTDADVAIAKMDGCATVAELNALFKTFTPKLAGMVKSAATARKQAILAAGA